MSEPRRLHPAGVVLMAVRLGRELLFPVLLPIVLQIVRSGFDMLSPSFLLFAFVGPLVLVAVSATYGVLAWRRYTYQVVNGELRIAQGVFSRKLRLIPQPRVQAVDISQGILQRLFGVVSVRIETAGGGGRRPEVSLAAVSFADARRLQQALSERPLFDEPRPVAATPEAELIRALPWSELLLAGATSGRVGIAASLVLSIIAVFDEVVIFDWLYRLIGPSIGLVVAPILTFLVLMIVWVLGVIGVVLAHAGFRLSRVGGNLLIERGLLERRRATIPINRIQALRIVHGVFRQPFGLAELRVESAGYGGRSGESTVLFPLLRDREIDAFVGQVMPELEISYRLAGLPKRARQRYAMRMIWPLLPVVLLICIVLFPWGLLSSLVLPVAGMLGLWQYRSAGWATTGDVLTVRSRQIGLTTALVPRRRIQFAVLAQSPFQRRARLARLSARVASGSGGVSFGLQHLDLEVAEQLYAWAQPGRGRRDDSFDPISRANTAVAQPSDTPRRL